MERKFGNKELHMRVHSLVCVKSPMYVEFPSGGMATKSLKQMVVEYLGAKSTSRVIPFNLLTSQSHHKQGPHLIFFKFVNLKK
jgi:hypothetical protein